MNRTAHKHFIAAAPRIARAFHACRDYDESDSPAFWAHDEPGRTFWALSAACNANADAIIATRPEGMSVWDAAKVAQSAASAGHPMHDTTKAAQR